MGKVHMDIASEDNAGKKEDSQVAEKYQTVVQTAGGCGCETLRILLASFGQWLNLSKCQIHRCENF